MSFFKFVFLLKAIIAITHIFFPLVIIFVSLEVNYQFILFVFYISFILSYTKVIVFIISSAYFLSQVFSHRDTNLEMDALDNILTISLIF